MFFCFGFLGFAIESLEMSESPSSSSEEDDDADAADSDELKSFFERRPRDTTALRAFFEDSVKSHVLQVNTPIGCFSNTNVRNSIFTQICT